MKIDELKDKQNIKCFKIYFTREDIQQVLVHLVATLYHLEKKERVFVSGLEKLKAQLRIYEHRDPEELVKIYKLDNQALIDIFNTYILQNDISFKELYRRCENSIDLNEEWIKHDEDEFEGKFISRKEKNTFLQRIEDLKKDKQVLKIFKKLNTLGENSEISSVIVA
ncbi:MAG: hypothetical protein U9N33_12665 [Campylobacterota bacterium]|nr:hypothetical protein [Campylobacterota bacterium]